MKSFIEWLEALDPVQSTMTIAPSNSGDNAQLGYKYDPRYPVRDPNDHWAFNMFKNWYAQNWGRWDDVERAAQTNPQVKSVLQGIARTLEKDGIGKGSPVTQGLDGQDEFDIEAPSLMEKLAKQLQQYVKPANSNGGMSQKPNSMVTRAATGNPTWSSSMPSTQKATPAPQSPTYGRQTQNAQQGQATPSLDQTQILPLLQKMMDRIERIEQHLTARR
jgi:hypothetical protein